MPRMDMLSRPAADKPADRVLALIRARFGIIGKKRLA
jgi:hypothetical protein